MKTNKVFHMLVLLALLFAAIPVMFVEAAPAPKVDVCHREGNGSFHLINVSANAVPAHLAHGDGVPGGVVPSMDGYIFDDACVPVQAPPEETVLLEGSVAAVSSPVEIENLAGLAYSVVGNGDGSTTFCLTPTLFDGSPYLKALTVGITNEAGDFNLDLTYGSSDGTPPDDELVLGAGGAYCYTAPAGSLPSGELGIFFMVNGRAPDNGNDLQRWIGIVPMTTANDWGGFDWSWANRFKITLP